MVKTFQIGDRRMVMAGCVVVKEDLSIYYLCYTKTNRNTNSMNSSHSISSSCAHSILFPGYLPTTHDFGAEGCSKLTKLTFESLNCCK